MVSPTIIWCLCVAEDTPIACDNDATPDNSRGSWCRGSVVESYHLSKLYQRGVYALHDLLLTVEKGEFLFLTGPSGREDDVSALLLREELPTEGELKVLGRDLSTL